MAYTNFPNGITSFGIPVMGSGVKIPSTRGKYIFVDGTNGSAAYDGTSPTSAYSTIALGVAAAAVDDVVIVLPATYTEAVTAAVAGVHIIGLGSSIKSVVWTSAVDTKSLSLTAANIEVAGFYFKPPVYSASASVCSISLSNASYANIHDNRFQGQTGSYNAIYSAAETSDNVTIANNDFEYMNTASNGAAILTLAAGGLSYSDWLIVNNKFSSCVKAIVLAGARVAGIFGNHIGSSGVVAAGTVGAVTTTGINLSGTSSGANMVHGNWLGGTYSAVGGYTVGASGDDWSGNFNIAGITAANPA